MAVKSGRKAGGPKRGVVGLCAPVVGIGPELRRRRAQFS